MILLLYFDVILQSEEDKRLQEELNMLVDKLLVSILRYF